MNQIANPMKKNIVIGMLELVEGLFQFTSNVEFGYAPGMDVVWDLEIKYNEKVRSFVVGCIPSMVGYAINQTSLL